MSLTQLTHRSSEASNAAIITANTLGYEAETLRFQIEENDCANESMLYDNER
jgi:hypothetical protein